MKRRIAAIIVVIALALTSLGIITVHADLQYTTQTDYDGIIKGQALDVIQGDGANLFTPGYSGDYLSENKATIYGPFQTVTFSGWFGLEDNEIVEFGYAIGENAPVFDVSFIKEPEAPVKAAGGEYAMRYVIVMDVSALGEELTSIMPVAKLDDGTVLALHYLDLKYTTKEKNQTDKPVTLALTSDRTNDPLNFSSSVSVGFRFVVPEGYKLNTFTVQQAPTWNGPTSGIGCTADIYRWTGDYDETIEADPIGEYVVEDHKDCMSMEIAFDSYVPAGTYLIELTEFTGNLGGWLATEIAPEFADTYCFYQNSYEDEKSVHVKMTVVVDNDPPAPTEVPPTKEPTQVPEETATPEPPTEAPTDAPATEAPTEAPKDEPTKAPESDNTANPAQNGGEKGDVKKSGPSLGLILGIAGGVIAVAAVIIGVAVSKKKKK